MMYAENNGKTYAQKEDELLALNNAYVMNTASY